MKVIATLVTCIHTTKHGPDSYARLVKKSETIGEVIEAIQKDCDYDENNPGYNEYFDTDTETIIIDTDDFEVVAS